MKAKKPKPVRAWMAWNQNIPWEDSTRRLRADCIASVKANLHEPEKDFDRSFTVRRVTIIAV